MSESPDIFVWAHVDAAARAYLNENLVGYPIYFADKSAPTALDRIRFAQAEIVFGNVPSEWLAGENKISWLQLESVGFEYYSASQVRKEVVITNLKGMFDRPAAETALAGLLSLYRGYDELIPAQIRRDWICLDLRPRMRLLHGQRVLVLGLGSIGLKIRDLLHAFRCEVTTFARTSTNADLHTLAQVDALLPSQDVIICALPKTKETINLLDRRRLGLMAGHAILVNVGRGAVVDESALIDVLQNQRIGGAVLDVSQEEPLPAQHPLWACPRTILSQHTGGGYADELLDKAKAFVANLARYRAQQRLHHIIDLQRHY